MNFKEGDENWHEGEEGYCRQFDIIAFWITRAVRAAVREARTASFASSVTFKEGDENRHSTFRCGLHKRSVSCQSNIVGKF